MRWRELCRIIGREMIDVFGNCSYQITITIQSESFHFPGHTEYIEERVGEGQKALMILLKNDFRVALVTGHVLCAR